MNIILAVNSGSSSLKFQLFDMPEESVIVSGQIERIGFDDAIVTMKSNGEKFKDIFEIKNHNEAVSVLLDNLSSKGFIEDINDITGVGHRVVHGGEIFSHSVIIDDDVIFNIENLSKLAPLHNPVNLVGILAFQEALPQAVQVAVFDTAFHQTMKPCTYLYPLPYRYYQKHKIRKYGFHGTSHYYVSRKVAQLMNKNVDDLNIISIHLGGGASITAIEKGKSVNTSMGFTPLAGIMMGTRSGDVDPAILPFIVQAEGISSSEVLDIFNHQSGMKGVSGISSDARDILKAADKGDQRAILTLQMYSNRIAEVIGSYYIRLKHVDALVFTGGIGENATTMRADIFEEIAEPMRLKIDEQLNLNTFGTNTKISLPDSASQVWIVPTDEELVIARDTEKLIEKTKA